MSGSPGAGGASRPPREPSGSRPPLPPRIVLVGFMGAGKSTVGRILADRLGYDFVDLDEEVERVAGRTVPEIFRVFGEAAFRRLEAEATARLDHRREIVVATGGGWMARPELRGRWTDAVRVWLRVGSGSIRERLGGRWASRPLLDRESPERALREILRARAPAYRLAEIRVDTDGRSAVDVAGRILALLEERGGERGGGPEPAHGSE